MSRKIYLTGLVLGLTTLAALPVSAETNINMESVEVVQGAARTELMVGVEAWSGDNTYQIGHPVHWFDGSVDLGYFPFSELAFPLDTAMATVQGSVEVHDTWQIMASIKTDITDPGDQMIDKDWLTGSDPDQLDVYSTNNITEFDGFEFDTSFHYKFLNNNTLSLNGGAGYLYQSWEYTTALVEQYSPSGMDGFDYLGDGSPGVHYKLEYFIPYFQMGGNVKLGKAVTLFANLSYSPWVYAENVDEHLLRYKENKGDLDGDAWMFTVGGRVDFTDRWFMNASYDYKNMKVEGTMNAQFADSYKDLYGLVPNHSVWEEIETVQHILAVNMGYHF